MATGETSSVEFEYGCRRFEFLLPGGDAPAPVDSARSIVTELRNYVREGELVLEVGAGVGLRAVLLADAGRVRVGAFEADPSLHRLLTENVEKCGVRGIQTYSHEHLDDVALEAVPRLLIVSSGTNAVARLSAVSTLLTEHRPDVALIDEGNGQFEAGARSLAAAGYVPRTHLGHGGAVLFSHGTVGTVDLAFLAVSGVRAITAALQGSAVVGGREGAGALLQHLVEAVGQLTSTAGANAREMRVLLGEQLVHARRVDAQLFDVSRWLKHRTPSDAARPPGVTGVAPRSSAVRKLRKFVKDPKGFLEDSNSRLIRGLRRKSGK